MFNLLPDSIKRKIKIQYNLRRLVVVLIIVLFTEVAVFIFFSPSWLVSYYKERAAISETENMSKSLENTKSVVNVIKLTNSKMNVLGRALDYPKILPSLNSILSQKTASIHINEFAFATENGKKGTISVGGVSATREALVAFKKALENSGAFKTVNLPVSNLAKDRDITFSLSIAIAP